MAARATGDSPAVRAPRPPPERRCRLRAGEEWEPEHVLEGALLHFVLGAGDGAVLGRAACVSRGWRSAASAQVLWERPLGELWAGKQHVPAHCLALRDRGSHRDAYLRSLEDSRRTSVTAEELVGSVWRFRFKRQAGEGWTARDPYWRGLAPLRVRFHPDGRVVPEPLPAAAATVFSGDEEAAAGVFAAADVRWRLFDGSPSSVHAPGTLLRFSVDGRVLPTYVVSRHAPTWGFVLQSCWSIYASFELPPLGADPQMEDDRLEVTVSRQYREVLAYNRGDLEEAPPPPVPPLPAAPSNPPPQEPSGEDSGGAESGGSGAAGGSFGLTAHSGSVHTMLNEQEGAPADTPGASAVNSGGNLYVLPAEVMDCFAAVLQQHAGPK